MDLVTAGVSLISAIIGALIGGQLSRVASLEATEIAHRNNLDLQEKNRKADAYSRVIEALHNAKISANQFLQVELSGRELSDEAKKALKSLEEAAYAAIWKAIDIGTFVLSEEALIRLARYEKDMDEAWKAAKEGPWFEYLETVRDAAEKCLTDIIEIAKRDLKAV